MLRRLIGLLLGMSLVGGFGYFELLDAYRDASERMLASVEELKLSTEAVRQTSHLPLCVLRALRAGRDALLASAFPPAPSQQLGQRLIVRPPRADDGPPRTDREGRADRR